MCLSLNIKVLVQKLVEVELVFLKLHLGTLDSPTTTLALYLSLIPLLQLDHIPHSVYFFLLVAHLGLLSHLLGADFNSHGSNLLLQDILVMIGIDLITLGVNNQALHFSFKISTAEDCISLSSH